LFILLSFFSVEFSVEKIQDIEWNEDAFNNLVLPHDHKYLLQSLVQAHNNEIGFDDFIKGKGHGLVVNLFGPPGVGEFFLKKTFFRIAKKLKISSLNFFLSCFFKGKPSRPKLRVNLFVNLCML
jgi:hypothetical protein